MEDTVGSRSQQQGEAMAAMAADDDEIGTDLPGQRMDFGLGSTEYQVLIFFADTQGACKLRKVGSCRFLNLFLNGGQIHRNVTAVGEAEWFDDMCATQSC